MNIKRLITFSIVVFAFIACNKTTVVIIEEYENGDPKIVREYVKNDTANYLETKYYSANIKMIEGAYVDGKREGTWKAWYQDGTLWSEGDFKEGKNNGNHVNYYENGAQRISGKYIDGVRTGAWTFYDTLGNVLQVIEY
ncbi:MAG: hypothetical protein LBP67_04930 [Bacteroidales bacterium]|jgi:antitoxin component YwqK of YwqJK toxin-antitoxin module|nr:hypothetical protein [Bacteroidales bacterium]